MLLHRLQAPLAAALVGLAACAAPSQVTQRPFTDTGALTTTTDTSWTQLEDGALEVRPGAGNLLTTAEFGDAHIELEFWCPSMDRSLGIDRGNSGVYVQGRYEVQVLDSFEMPRALNSCGALYQISAPRVNASLPPETWQSFIIDFTAARFDRSGVVTESPRMTVWQNGIRIQNDVELPAPTPGGLGSDVVERGPLMLQDHGQLVRYRNLSITADDPDPFTVGFSFGAGVLVD
jgi:hypothetical protein